MSVRRTSGTALREPHPRITFEDLVLHQVGDHCSAQVMLSLSKGVEMVGAAEATARAIEGAAQGKLKLTVLNVTLVETVDALLVLVALASRAKEDGERLVGSSLVKGQEDLSVAWRFSVPQIVW